MWSARDPNRTGRRLGLFRLCAAAGSVGWIGIAVSTQRWMPCVISVVLLGFATAAGAQLFAAMHVEMTRDPSAANDGVVSIARMAMTGGWVIGPAAGTPVTERFGLRETLGYGRPLRAQIIPGAISAHRYGGRMSPCPRCSPWACPSPGCCRKRHARRHSRKPTGVSVLCWSRTALTRIHHSSGEDSFGMPAPQMALQLYSVRHLLEANEKRTLAQIAALGLHTVEVYDFVSRAGTLPAALREAGLTARTGHAGFLSPDTSSASGQVVRLEETLHAALALGLETVFDPFVAPDRWVHESDVAATADRLNQAAEAAAAHGLAVGYHNHSQEFVHEIKGVSAFEHFAGLLDPRVKLEIDLYWAAAGGNDPVSLVERLGSRVEALHVKDGAVIDDPFFSGAPFDPADTGQVAPGQGQIPLDASLSAAHHARWAVIEFDHYDGDVLDGIEAAVRYLHTKGIR